MNRDKQTPTRKSHRQAIPQGGDDASVQSSNPTTDWILKNYDHRTTDGPDVDIELSRLQALKSFQLLDRAPSACFERLASVAARMLNAPIAQINLVDLGRLWPVASFGLSTYATLGQEMPRVTSLCAHTILQKEFLLVVPDLLEDSRFRDTPWAKAGIRFYSGVPLVSPEGAHIGSLCVMDDKPRTAFREAEQEQIVDLAASVMDLMAEKRLSMSSRAPPGVTFSYDVQRAAAFLRQQLYELKNDSHFQSVASGGLRHVLQSACNSAEFLHASLVRDEERRSEAKQAEHEGSPNQRIGEVKSMEMEIFVKSLETAMEAFPRKVHLSFTLHPAVPPQLCFNDLKVFRSAIALLTSACERTQEGFIRFKIYPRDSSSAVVFECEDTGRDVDLDRYERLFQPPSEGIDVGFEECIRMNHNGQIEQNIVCDDLSAEPVSGGFAVHAVAEYVSSMGGKYGFRPRFVYTENQQDSSSGSVFWFSIPVQIPRPRGAASALDSAIDSAIEVSTTTEIHRVDPSVTRSWS